jgi:hypothetical protein
MGSHKNLLFKRLPVTETIFSLEGPAEFPPGKIIKFS